MADILLLNATNFAAQPIYPYAFVQVRALARRRGLSLATHDFFCQQRESWPELVERLVRTHRPRMVAVHVRQADSVNYSDYVDPDRPPYHPLEDTLDLVRVLRNTTDATLAMGGFGFTTHARHIFSVAKPDVACCGEPDALLANFEDVVRGRALDNVSNLLFERDGQVQATPRHFYAPLNEREYDDAVVRELEAFYGRPQLFSERAPTVAVELARGCPYHCYFCTEPGVKGRTERRRDLEAVMADVEFLARRGVQRFWMVCSELNLKDTELAMSVAERFGRLNEGRARRLRWHAYHLPRWFTRRELETLYRSGFAGGWNDFPSLEDENLRRTRVPYRARHAVEHLRTTLELQPTDPYGDPPRFSLFLGNSRATAATVARTLERFQAEGFTSYFASASISPATRVFATESDPDLSDAVTFERAGARRAESFILPTFVLNPELRRVAGGSEALLSFFRYAESTLLSQKYRAQLDWAGFLMTAAPPIWTAQQLELAALRRPRGLPPRLVAPVESVLARFVTGRYREELEAFAFDLTLSPDVRRYVALALVHGLTHPVPARYLDALDLLGIAHERGQALGSPYQLLRQLLAHFDSTQSVLDFVTAKLGLGADDRSVYALRCLLFERNVVLRPEYRQLIIPPAGADQPGLESAQLPRAPSPDPVAVAHGGRP